MWGECGENVGRNAGRMWGPMWGQFHSSYLTSYWAILYFFVHLSTRRVTPLTGVFNILELLQITLICWLLNFPICATLILIPPDYQV